MKNETKELELALKNRKLTSNEYKRILGVIRRKEGTPRKEIVRVLGVSMKTLETWITAYNKKGVEGLLNFKRDTSSTAKLKPGQIKQLEEWLKKETPVSMGISGQDYWDVPTLELLIKEKYKVEYKSHGSYTGLFKRCGFTYQKVEFQDTRRNEEAVDEFKKRFEKKLKKGGSIVMSW